MAGVRQQARGSGGGADGGDQARGRPGPAGTARGGSGRVCGVRGAGREVGRGRSRKNRQSESEGGVSGRGGGEGGAREEEGAWGGAQGTDVLVCISLQDERESCYGRNGMRSALHIASEGGLAGTVAQLLSLGADAALKDAVRACTCMRTWSYTYSMRVYSLGAYIRLCYKNRHIHT